MKTIVYIGTSLDGFIARKDGSIEWLEQFANDEAIRAYEEFIVRIDVVVIGKGTFEKALSFPSWPYQQKTIVLSSSLKQVPERVKDKVEILSAEPKDVLDYLSGKGYSTGYIDGGNTIQRFLKDNRVDELIISSVPVIIGTGIPLFADLGIDLHLRFKHTRTDIATNGLVRTYYIKD